MQNTIKYCIWLTFESELLKSIIHELSKRYSAPVFQPHCTIIGRTEIPLIKLKSAVINVIDDHNIKEISLEGIGYRDEYWMSYFLTISEKHILTYLHNNLMKLLGLSEDLEYLPHISLLYCSLSESEKREIIIPINFGNRIKTRSIQITECGEKVENWKPVFELIL